MHDKIEITSVIKLSFLLTRDIKANLSHLATFSWDTAINYNSYH